MSGESREPGVWEWQWAHILWQRKGLRLDEFAGLSHNAQLAFIASEELALERPINANERLASVYIKSR